VTKPASLPRAFTLIEVLLGVLILGLGLLGLASVFPLVVKQQRAAQDVVLGVAAAGGAEAVLRGHSVLNDPAGLKGWGPFSKELHAAARKNTSAGFQSLWTDVLEAQTDRLRIYGAVSKIGNKVGEAGSFRLLGASGSSGNPEVVIYTSDRLLPQGPGVTPQYVWDAVPILASPATSANPTEFATLRVAVFIRRIDPGIRVGANTTLAEVISSGNAVAVGVDNDGLPTFSGQGNYAVPIVATPVRSHQRYGINTAPYTVIEFNAPRPAVLVALRQVGQQIVDTEGNVYTVVAIPDEKGVNYTSDRAVVISPPLAPQTVKAINGGGGTTAGEVQFLVSPVVPASVEVLTIRQ
jgi:prepilin-type N-terminal cleavage/methylation domain-containing protein